MKVIQNHSKHTVLLLLIIVLYCIAVFGSVVYYYGIAREDTIQKETALQQQVLHRLFRKCLLLEKRVERLEKNKQILKPPSS